MPSAQTSQGHLRTRKIDYRKQLGVLRHGDVDLDELRPALQQPAAQGVEKDEQSELHLVAALQLNTSSTRAVIPTPHSSSSKEYDTLYTADYARPSKLVCWSALVEDVIGCDYNAGPEDQQWLTSQSLSIADFERMVFLLERVGDEKDVGAPPTLAEAREFAIEAPVCADPVFDLVYRYWRDRRYQTLRERLKPTLKVFLFNLVAGGKPCARC